MTIWICILGSLDKGIWGKTNIVRLNFQKLIYSFFIILSYKYLMVAIQCVQRRCDQPVSYESIPKVVQKLPFKMESFIFVIISNRHYCTTNLDDELKKINKETFLNFLKKYYHYS